MKTIKLLLILVVFLVSGCNSNAGRHFINNPAPVTLLTMEDGTTKSLSQYEGNPVVISFWATWCKSSGPIMSRLNNFAGIHPNVPVLVISIDKLDQEKDVKERMLRYPNLKLVYSGNDVSDIAYTTWEGDMIPYLAVIEGDGRVVAVGNSDDIVYEHFKVPTPHE